jgi:two-component system alkaline phosphatase synthesis response regulator PhoP
MIRLLLLEDEINIGATLSELLGGAGYEVLWVQSRAEALDALRLYAFDIALLDVTLPDGTGFQVAEKLDTTRTAMLFLTAMSDPEHRVRGLQLGAEDYILKPFHFQELLLRLRNALKRRDYQQLSAQVTPARIGRAEINFATFTAKRDGAAEEKLTAREMRLLKLLYDRRGKVVSRDEILGHVWPSETFPTARTVDNFILRLRKLVEDDPAHPQIIQTLRGVGYCLKI